MGTTLSAWLLSEEESLRLDQYHRDRNAVVAYALLPIFESEPSGWNAIRRLPVSSAMFEDYLLEWHRQAEPADKPFITLVQSAFQQGHQSRTSTAALVLRWAQLLAKTQMRIHMEETDV